MAAEMGVRAVCIVTFRNSAGARLRNLHYVLRWLDRVPGLETLVVEQDERPHVDPGLLPPSCRVLFARNPGPFNKSWGFNVGFRAATGDVLAFADADIIVDEQQFRLALDACARDCEVVRPWSAVVDLTEDETEALVAGSLDAKSVTMPARQGRGHLGERPPLCGGLYVIRRDVYEHLGGQDERFRGWGGEDDAMSFKVATLCRKVAVVRGGLAFHLHHPRHASLPVEDADYQANVALLREYQRLSQEELARLCAEQKLGMGDANRFACEDTRDDPS